MLKGHLSWLPGGWTLIYIGNKINDLPAETDRLLISMILDLDSSYKPNSSDYKKQIGPFRYYISRCALYPLVSCDGDR